VSQNSFLFKNTFLGISFISSTLYYGEIMLNVNTLAGIWGRYDYQSTLQGT
jgi:hypothetical protein